MGRSIEIALKNHAGKHKVRVQKTIGEKTGTEVGGPGNHVENTGTSMREIVVGESAWVKGPGVTRGKRDCEKSVKKKQTA